MTSLRALLEPTSIAVVGASQRPGPGTRVIANLQSAGFQGEIFAVNPRYSEVLGCKCVASVSDLPKTVECLVVAVGAEAACSVLEEAHGHGIGAAVVLSAGFGEGRHLEAHAARVRAVAEGGMRICGPNCFGIVSTRSGTASFSGVIPRTLISGSVALVSQSGSLGNFVFSPLMRDRKLGFSHFISCGNQLGTTIEDYAEYLVEDPNVKVIAVILEALKNPRKLAEVARRAHAQQKSMIFCQVGKSKSGQLVIGSHTGALAGNSEILQAFLRRCGIMTANSYDEFVEAIELLAHVPFDENLGQEVIIVSGSGGAAAVATDHLEQEGMVLRELRPQTKERLRAVLPAFASATNPIDATGVVYDDPALLPSLFDAILSEPGRPIIAASVIAAPVERMRRIAAAIAETARSSGRTIVAYQPSPLGAVDDEIVNTLHAAGVPLLLGISHTMAALKHLSSRRDYTTRALHAPEQDSAPVRNSSPLSSDFLTARQALTECGIPVVDAASGVFCPGGSCAVAAVRTAGCAQGGGARPPAQERPWLRAPQLCFRSRSDCRLQSHRAERAEGGLRAGRGDRSADGLRHCRSLCGNHR